MPQYGLIGYPLSHSFSQKYFSEKFSKLHLDDCSYLNFEIDAIEKLNDVINEHPDLKGFNVTIPYKETVIKFLNELDEIATEVGAVNTVKVFKVDEKRILRGYNTDVFGFEESLKPLLKQHHKAALILGTGGASKAIAYVLKKLNISFQFVSRVKFKTILGYNDLNESAINNHQLIINTTPLGSFPDVENAPQIPFQYLNSNHLCYDLIYNPEETLFLKKAKEQGAEIKNGFEMLKLQAERAYEIWTETKKL
ncbi:MAG: shikimate dehydrogenase [Bacteroidia bacterium]